MMYTVHSIRSSLVHSALCKDSADKYIVCVKGECMNKERKENRVKLHLYLYDYENKSDTKKF